MQHSQPFSRLRPSSVVLALALLFALAGLYAVDRALSESSRTHVQVQVTESGALVQGFLSVHAEALQGLRGLYLDTSHAVVGEHFHSLAMSMSEYGTSFRRLWVTDSTGRITEMHLFGPSAPALPVGVDIDTAGAFELDVIAEAARRTGRTLVSVPRTLVTGEHGVILLEPIYLGGRFLGFAGGSVTSQAILESVTQGRPPVRGYLAVLAGIDTVVATKTPIPTGPGIYRASSTFRVPGGASWKVVILEQSTLWLVRRAARRTPK